MGRVGGECAEVAPPAVRLIDIFVGGLAHRAAQTARPAARSAAQ